MALSDAVRDGWDRDESDPLRGFSGPVMSVKCRAVLLKVWCFHFKDKVSIYKGNGFIWSFPRDSHLEGLRRGSSNMNSFEYALLFIKISFIYF